MPLIKFYANLRTITGKKEITLLGSTLQQVLGTLIREYPGLQRFLLEDGQLRAHVIIAVNGQIMDKESCLQVPVSEQDRIAIFPPMAGG